MCEMMLCGLSGHVWKGNVFNKEQMFKGCRCFKGKGCFMGYVWNGCSTDVLHWEQVFPGIHTENIFNRCVSEGTDVSKEDVSQGIDVQQEVNVQQGIDVSENTDVSQRTDVCI